VRYAHGISLTIIRNPRHNFLIIPSRFRRRSLFGPKFLLRARDRSLFAGISGSGAPLATIYECDLQGIPSASPRIARSCGMIKRSRNEITIQSSARIERSRDLTLCRSLSVVVTHRQPRRKTRGAISRASAYSCKLIAPASRTRAFSPSLSLSLSLSAPCVVRRACNLSDLGDRDGVTPFRSLALFDPRARCLLADEIDSTLVEFNRACTFDFRFIFPNIYQSGRIRQDFCPTVIEIAASRYSTIVSSFRGGRCRRAIVSPPSIWRRPGNCSGSPPGG